MRIVKKAPAKINLYLYLPGRREDGYHLIDSCMQALSLYDEVCVEVKTPEEGGSGKIDLATDAAYLMQDPSKNTAYRAAVLFSEKLPDPNYDIKITIKKNIPAQAGLGGGSTDGAATLLALSEMFPGLASEKELLSMAVRVGADVPFFLKGGTVLCEGIGEIMTEAVPLQGLPILLMKPEAGVSTLACYKRFDAKSDVKKTTEQEHQALQEFLFPAETCPALERVKKVCGIWRNDLEAPALEEAPEIGKAAPLMRDYGAFYAAMSGSGSAVFGIFEEEKDIDRLLSSDAWSGLQKNGWSAFKVFSI